MDGEAVAPAVGAGIGGIARGAVCVPKKYNLNAHTAVAEFVLLLASEGGKVVLYCT